MFAFVYITMKIVNHIKNTFVNRFTVYHINKYVFLNDNCEIKQSNIRQSFTYKRKRVFACTINMEM